MNICRANRQEGQTWFTDADSREPLSLRETVNVLREHYGSPDPLPTKDPFELILWENIVYLASPARRREAFDKLKRTIGTEPETMLKATQQTLESVTAGGILKSTFAAKLRQCAIIAVTDFDGDLGRAVRGPLDAAKRALRSFPGIGEPGAEKILLFAGQQPLLAPDSNALRVLVRLGFVREEKSYSRMYSASRDVAKDFPQQPRVLQEAHLLLQQHGRTLCKRGAPRCEICPLAAKCGFAGRDLNAK